MELFENSINELSVLQELKIKHCDLRNLQTDCFNAIPNLRSLTIISPRNYRHISFNNLVDLSSLIVANILDLSILKKFNPRITSLTVLNSINKNNFDEFLSIIETHFTCLNLIHLSLINCINHFDINRLPKDIKLQTLCLDDCGLKTINLNDNDSSQQYSGVKKAEELNTTNSTRRLERLKYLCLADNKIICLDVSMFAKIQNLEILDLSRCSLKTIQRDLFRSLINLKNLKLCGNNIEILEDNIFADLKYLESLYLSYNRICEVSEATFSGLFNLEYLYLYQNPLKPVDANIFIKFKQLKQVQLNSNNVKNRRRFEEIYGSRISFAFIP